MTALPLKPSSTYTEQQARDYLTQAQLPIRLACLGKADQQAPAPLVASHWFIFEDDKLWCISHKDSAFCRNLQHSPRCGFEIAADTMPYRGIRGQGVARLNPESGQKFLEKLMIKYAVGKNTQLGRFLLARAADEIAIAITPQWLTSWDFSDRMADVK